MQRTHLLMIAILALCCAGQASAQSQQLNASLAGASQNDRSISPANTAAADQYANHPSHDPRRARPLDPSAGWQGPTNVTCYTIRSYRVIRDDPHSDMTYRDGASTCVPSDAVHMYSAIDRGR